MIVPDLRGLGLSSEPAGGFDKKTQAEDVVGVLAALGVGHLDRFWNEFSASPGRFSESARKHHAALNARPGAMHSGFAQFAAFDQDAVDNCVFLAAGGRLKMPVFAVGGQNSFGPMMPTVMRAAADDVTEGIVPDSGHWITEENPRATTRLVRDCIK